MILTLRVLLNSGADVNTIDKNGTEDSNGNTPLHLAVINGSIDIVTLLLQNNASVSIKNNNGNTPIHLAAEYQRKKVMEVLLVYDPNAINTKDKYNWTPLHRAAKNGSTEIVIDLLDKGADVNATANYGDDSNGTQPSITALHLAAMNGHALTVLALLSYGADASAQDRFGNTPLHAAVINNRIDVVKVIISTISHNNTVLSIKNSANETAFDIAKYNGYSDIVEALSNAGASRKKKRNAVEGELQQ